MNERVATPAPQSEATTPTSIRFALFFFVVAFVVPVMGYLSVRESHDGFKIFGTFLVVSGVGAVAALIAVICTFVGLTQEPRSIWTRIAGFLTLVAVFLFVVFLANLK